MMDVKISVLVLGLLVAAGAQETTIYFQIGGRLDINPGFKQEIFSITWKLNANIVAEWIKDTIELEYLGDLKGRADLDVTSGVLTVRPMTKADDGKFTVEINNVELPVQFKAVGIRSLTGAKVEVVARPLTCATTANCVLTCEVDSTNVGPATFSWKGAGEEEWREGEKSLTVLRDDKTGGFSCRAKNKFGEAESEQLQNPFLEESGGGSGVLAGVGVFAVIVVAIASFGAYFYYKKCMDRREPVAASDVAGDVNGKELGNNDQHQKHEDERLTHEETL